MNRNLLASFFLFIWCLPAKLPAADEVARLITKPGNYHFFGPSERLTLNVSVDHEDVTFVMVSALHPQSENTFKLWAKEGPFWLIYVETPRKVWLFRDNLLTELELERSGITSTPYRRQDIVDRAPKLLLSSLPDAVRSRLKPH